MVMPLAASGGYSAGSPENRGSTGGSVCVRSVLTVPAAGTENRRKLFFRKSIATVGLFIAAGFVGIFVRLVSGLFAFVATLVVSATAVLAFARGLQLVDGPAPADKAVDVLEVKGLAELPEVLLPDVVGPSAEVVHRLGVDVFFELLQSRLGLRVAARAELVDDLIDGRDGRLERLRQRFDRHFLAVTTLVFTLVVVFIGVGGAILVLPVLFRLRNDSLESWIIALSLRGSVCDMVERPWSCAFRAPQRARRRNVRLTSEAISVLTDYR